MFLVCAINSDLSKIVILLGAMDFDDVHIASLNLKPVLA